MYLVVHVVHYKKSLQGLKLRKSLIVLNEFYKRVCVRRHIERLCPVLPMAGRILTNRSRNS